MGGNRTMQMPTGEELQITEFICARCGNCCRGEGFVRVFPNEAQRIAEFLGIPVEQFLREYTRVPDLAEDVAAGVRWLIDKPGPLRECIFLDGNACRIHPVKPQRCRDFPLKWRTPDAFTYCEGLRS
ncbi:MAG: YkgJ family cysteine cluster protein [Candidatus Hydrogenedentota bacterium]|jgi:Fe-S-cluster containining protein|uniref:YkgJ family cysteine cluster protein n=1 Tax=Sumerlaea chitinivorans TaxID=2250252 RepID=A0A2Z4Y286_SUMC1|nr:hypothetical protein BRCON_0085 [Candidatus Sumerlaea chitinivorans]RMH26387.1 MAG: YkgJ family cysteine cluster protein [Candidatus Hydrogenedentota bacterium]